MNITRLGANLLAKSVSSVSFQGKEDKHVSKPSFDSVAISKAEKRNLDHDCKKCITAANSLSTSTSGHRAIYGSELFDKDVVEALTMGVADYAKEQAAIKGKKRPVVMVGGDTRQATRESIPVIIKRLQESDVDVYHIEEPVATPVLALMAEKKS